MYHKVKNKTLLFINNSLYKNSLYLMLTTFTGALAGMLFWVINTKIFTPDQIGLATALISSMTLISNLSMLGLNTGIIRYLPKANNKSENINTVISVIALSSLFISIVYIIGLNTFAPKLSFLKENIFYLILFITFTIILSVDGIYSNVFIAYRSSKFIFYKSIVGNILKIISPYLLVSLGAVAIYIAASLGSVIALIVSIYILYGYFAYKIKFTIKKKILSNMFKLSFSNYIASFLASLPLSILPILIVNNLGAKEAGIFYLDLMIINLLSTIQSSIGQSLFAEGSNNDKDLKKHVISSVKFIILVLIPAILITIFGGKYILLIFGKIYSDDGIMLLQLLAISVIFTSINGLLSAILNIKGKVKLILMMCIIGPVILLSFIYFLLPGGLVSLGYAWLFGEGLISVIFLCVVYFKAIR
jgi:O-antigen/teichoic acid export membrane protein